MRKCQKCKFVPRLLSMIVDTIDQWERVRSEFNVAIDQLEETNHMKGRHSGQATCLSLMYIIYRTDSNPDSPMCHESLEFVVGCHSCPRGFSLGSMVFSYQ